MKLEQSNYDNSETGCCAKLDPRLWDEQEFEWHDKPFLRDHIREFLHIPLNYGSVISRDHQIVQDAEAYPEEPFWLTDEVSPWGAELYVALSEEIPGAPVQGLSGSFLTKVFEGPYRHAGRWSRAMNDYVSSKGKRLEKIYFYYATCPKCAKHYGANTVVLFAQVDDNDEAPGL